MIDFKLYLVTNRKLCAPAGLAQKISLACRAGIRAVQLREKNLPGRELYQQAQRLRQVTRETGTRLLINDRADIALACGADGIHCPENGLPPDTAKQLLPGGLVGASAHSLEAAIRAQLSGADFVLFGPVFETPAKKKFGPPQGLGALAAVVKQVSLPVFAIGGISPDNAFLCIRNGAAGVGVMSAILSAPDPSVVIREFDQVLDGL
jgi:thiamine-phosphate pyrophosphorylase